MKFRFWLPVACILATAAGSMPVVRAALLAYEPFTNAPGTAIIGSADGFGFSGAWQANSSGGAATNTSYGLGYTDASGNALLTSGGAGFFQGQTNGTGNMQPIRLFSFARGTNGTDGTTTWISFLVLRQGPTNTGANPYARGANVCHDINSGAVQKLAVGNSSGASNNTVALIPQGSGGNIKPSAVTFTQTNFVVVRINHNSGANDDAYLFVNPLLNVEPALGSANTNSIGMFDYSFDRLRVFAGGSNNAAQPYAELVIDEYRIGQTYADVSPYTSGSGTTNPPSITSQPTDQITGVGSDAVFAVAADGYNPLRYQWYFNTNTALNSATNAAFAFGSVRRTDAGKYSVVITNAAGSITSSYATLTVTNTPPVTGYDIILRPKDQALQIPIASLLTNDLDPDGDELALSGIGPTTTNGVSLTTNNTHVFYVNSQNVNDRFTYTVGDGHGGSATGTVFVTLVTSVPGRVQTVNVSGSTATLSFAAIPGYVYELQRSTNLTVWMTLATNLVPASGRFEVVVNFGDLGGPPAEAFYRLQFVSFAPSAPAIATQPQSLTTTQNQSVSFSVTATGTPAPTYQWYLNGAILSGRTGSTLVLNNVQTNNAGNYTVVLDNGFSSTTSSVAVLTVLVPPAITTQPQSLTVTQGQNATFTVAASGSAPLGYQWRFNGSSVGSATNALLTLSSVQTGAAGNYSVVVANAAGAVTSSVVALTVVSPPVITTQPQSQGVALGLNVTFTVNATGASPLRYQWYFNTNTLLVNATNSILAITNLQAGHAGGYSVVVTNTQGAAASSVATLTVLPPLVAGAYFVSVTNGNDANTGTEASPFKTISKGLSKVTAGGVVYVRAGVYALSSKLSLTSTSASATNRIRLWAYPGERPIIDSTGNTSDGIGISGDYYHLKGFEQRKAGHNGINISGDSNIVEFCSVHDNGNTGLHLTGSAPGPAGNLILNCDSYLNYDPPVGGNADGFSAKWDIGPGNVFRGCRCWWNSDDGWDLWMGTSAVLIEDCWAFYNGTNYWNDPQFNGNGQGFKLGGNYVGAPHRLLRSVAFKNEASGVDQNNNLDGQTIDNNTAWANKSRNFNLNHGTNDPPHIVRNNLSFDGASGDSFRSGTIFSNNSWQVISPAPNSGDFQSLDESVAMSPRQADGSLPIWPFLRPVNGGRLVDQGADIGQPFNGAAPDLGAFESP